MKLSLIASLVCLVSMVGCAATPAPIQQPQVVTVTAPPANPKSELVEDTMVTVEVVEVEVKGEMDPKDYQRLSSLITREVRGIKCVCANGDPLCKCRLPNGPKHLPQE